MRNSIARLYYTGHVANLVEGMDLEEALKLMCYLQDVRQEIMTRLWLVGTPKVLSAVMRALKESYGSDGYLYKDLRKILVS